MIWKNIWKKALAAIFKAMCRYLPEGTDEKKP
jgi:hypothetical protein